MSTEGNLEIAGTVMDLTVGVYRSTGRGEGRARARLILHSVLLHIGNTGFSTRRAKPPWSVDEEAGARLCWPGGELVVHRLHGPAYGNVTGPVTLISPVSAGGRFSQCCSNVAQNFRTAPDAVKSASRMMNRPLMLLQPAPPTVTSRRGEPPLVAFS